MIAEYPVLTEKTLRFPWPSPQHGPALVPVFLPFRGCPVRCIFCAQTLQTGQRAAVNTPLAPLLEQCRQRLEARAARGQAAAELAFYGGTFTALPEADRAQCLAFAAQMRAGGRIVSFRCSTRPDCLDAALLRELRDSGCTTVELGIQSFATEALTLARRGYDKATALRACALVREAGLRLGVQLLPGMPGSSVDCFLQDVKTALAAGAAVLRYYPCLVLEGTALAELWRQGRFVPWDMATTLQALAQGWLLARAAAVPVIRMGLAPEADLQHGILAGPYHAALGGRVMARALWLAVRDCLDGHGGTQEADLSALAAPAAGRPQSSLRIGHLTVPQSCQGYFWGHRQEMRPYWAALGLTPQNLSYAAAEEILLHVCR